MKRIVPGRLIKWEAVYDTPFWREQGLSGQAVADVGPANTTFDNTPPRGEPGILFGFVGGVQARRFVDGSRRVRRTRCSRTSAPTSATRRCGRTRRSR